MSSKETTIIDDKKMAKSSTISPQLSPSHPLFNSSSFFDPNNHPTINDQVTLCREIAKQLVCDESNAKSKGREMFERRVQKSSKWVTSGSFSDNNRENIIEKSDEYHERTISEGPPNLRLVLDPRHVQDITTLEFIPNEKIMNEKKMIDFSHNIVKDLTSPEVNSNKGKELFNKRLQKSEEWIVAETVVDLAQQKLSSNQWTQEPVMVSCGQEMSRTSLIASTGLFYPKYKDFNAKAKPFFKY